jgi:carbonic anhydrase
MKTTALASLLTLLAVSVVGCDALPNMPVSAPGSASVTVPVTAPLPSAEPVHTPAAPGASVHFSYAGEAGPDHWGDLSPAFAACKSGRSQSPVNITGTAKTDLPVLKFDYKDMPLKVLNNGHTIQVNAEAGSSLTIGDETYQLAQFHFHTPSEHTINGKSYDMEVHFVHKDAQGHLAVVGIMIEKGAANATLQSIWDNLPEEENEEKATPGVVFNGKALMPANQNYFNYSGSLTTPPCSEGVNWNVMTTSIQASEAQIAAFKKLFTVNARPVMALNNRVLKESSLSASLLKRFELLMPF